MHILSHESKINWDFHIKRKQITRGKMGSENEFWANFNIITWTKGPFTPRTITILPTNDNILFITSTCRSFVRTLKAG